MFVRFTSLAFISADSVSELFLSRSAAPDVVGQNPGRVQNRFQEFSDERDDEAGRAGDGEPVLRPQDRQGAAHALFPAAHVGYIGCAACKAAIYISTQSLDTSDRVRLQLGHTASRACNHNAKQQGKKPLIRNFSSFWKWFLFLGSLPNILMENHSNIAIC